MILIVYEHVHSKCSFTNVIIHTLKNNMRIFSIYFLSLSLSYFSFAYYSFVREKNQIIGATIGADLGTEKIELLDESALAAADAEGASAYTPISPTSAARDEEVSEVTSTVAHASNMHRIGVHVSPMNRDATAFVLNCSCSFD